jgi:hypothetical protein
MKRTALTLLACAVLIAAPHALLAQEPTPQPTPADWMAYDDPAMHFHAPAGFQPVGQRQIPLSKLGDDPTVVAAWVYPDKDHGRKLLIQQEYFHGGDVHAYQSQYEGQMRDQFDSPLFKDKQNITLKNGMPAIFEAMTTGSGFNVQKYYLLMWADGERGITVLLQTTVNDLNSDSARALISDASAVRYPIGRGDLQ